MKQYKSLVDLKRAMDSGELKLDNEHLTIDNDSTYLYLHFENENGVEDGECVFEMHPSQLLMEALDILDIPHDYA